MDLNDADLTERGLDASAQSGRMLLIACGALAREILALKTLNGWDTMDLTCLPAKLHNRPEQIPDAVEAAVLKHQHAYESIFVVYADCGTGGLLQQRCERLGVEMVAGPHCYAFFDGLDAFETNSQEEITAFYLTDFLVRQFDTLIWRGMKLDRHPELLGMFFGNYTDLIYLAQTEDPALNAKAEEAATRLGLAYKRRFTGYGDLATALSAANV
ncbi:MAG: DUF1638 domain-containing protein [Pseudomonadota bacterium]